MLLQLLHLVPKYVSVMSEEGHKKAADKVMSYTNNDFVTKFDQTKNLRNAKAFNLIQQLFRSIQYQVIVLQMLSSKVVDCVYTNKHLLSKQVYAQ